MKGLTPEEYRLLAENAAPHDPRAVNGDMEQAVFLDLEEQGRVCADWSIPEGRWAATPAGREAIRLWPLLRERFSREGSK